jgi:hypothetical protein
MLATLALQFFSKQVRAGKQANLAEWLRLMEAQYESSQTSQEWCTSF